MLGEENIGRERFTQLVLKSHFRDGGKCTSRFSDNSIEQIKSINYFTKNGSRFSNAENFEKFDYMERQAKFIQNAVRTYEFYGYQWLTPFFFRNQIIAWSKLSPLLRFERTAFFAFENKHYPENLKEIGFAAQVTKARVWRKVYQVAFDPYSLHQLMPIFSKLTYYRALLESKIYNINWLVKNEYLKSSGVGK